ncbi:hypothetical protein [Burkholderia sp. IDO3]|uniref:hypothetical protein n=1 Tax=Burkholderia sp. IDO3 TaxID=1705310 RepID=UPI0013B35886|nr:hypothetical protein [Burkholderia sp. IDO3]
MISLLGILNRRYRKGVIISALFVVGAEIIAAGPVLSSKIRGAAVSFRLMKPGA